MSRSLCRAITTELAATDNTSFDSNFWLSFDQSEWTRALAWLDLSGLALYFWQRMKSIKAEEALPHHVQAQLGKSCEENCARVAAIEKEFMILSKLFEDAGVEHAVLKGFALVPDYCPDPTLRTQYDHDYLVRPDSLRRAEEFLQSAGYVRKNPAEDHPIVYIRPALEVDPFAELLGLYSAGLGRSIELHLRLWDSAEENIELRLPEDFLDRVRRRPWRGSEYPALSDEDSLVFQVLHAFRHILRNWCRLSVFLEIAHFLRRQASDSNFWARYHSRIKTLTCVPEASEMVFSLAEKLFGGSARPEIKARRPSRISPVVDLWIERYGHRAALANFRNNKSSLFLHGEFVDDRSAWAKIWRRRLFPMHRPHRLPDVLCKRGPQGLGRRWAEHLHILRRFKFHAFSALCYAWEYPQWRLHRRARLLASSLASKSVGSELDKRECSLLLASEGGSRPGRTSIDA